MRRRWEFDPAPYIAAWFVCGFLAAIVGSALFNGCDPKGCGMNGPVGTVPIILMSVWLGPFVLVFVVAVAVFGGWCLWEGRPRRVTEPVTEDLRTVKR